MKIIKFVILAVGGFLFFIYGKNVSLESQWSLYEGLRTTSVIVFGLMGAWLAIVYPDILKKVLSNVTKEEKESLDFKRLLIPIRISIAILIIILSIGLIIPILRQLDSLGDHKLILRGISFAFLWVLTYFQIWALLLSVSPGEEKNQELKEMENQKTAVRHFKSRHSI